MNFSRRQIAVLSANETSMKHQLVRRSKIGENGNFATAPMIKGQENDNE